MQEQAQDLTTPHKRNTHKCAHTHARMHARMPRRPHTWAHTSAHAHAYTETCTHTHAHIPTYTDIHDCAHTRTHKHAAAYPGCNRVKLSCGSKSLREQAQDFPKSRHSKTHTCTHTHPRTFTQTHGRTPRAPSSTQPHTAHTHADTQTCTSASLHTHIEMYSHMQTYLHMHAHKQDAQRHRVKLLHQTCGSKSMLEQVQGCSDTHATHAKTHRRARTHTHTLAQTKSDRRAHACTQTS
jgi:hypothetical protein